MAAHAARRLMRMNTNLNTILGVEAICGAQGIGFRSPLLTSVPLQKVIDRLRQAVPALEADRYLAPDLQAAADLIAGGDLVRAAAVDFHLEAL